MKPASQRLLALALMTIAAGAGAAPSHAAEPTTCDEVVAALVQDQKRVKSTAAAVKRDTAALKTAQSKTKKAKTKAGKKKTKAAATKAAKKLKTSKAKQSSAKKTLARHKELSAELCTPGY